MQIAIAIQHSVYLKAVNYSRQSNQSDSSALSNLLTSPLVHLLQQHDLHLPPHPPGSFYGTSHVTAALQEARSSTSVSLRFRTGRGDALLLVAAGRTDYLLMLLEDGLLKVRGDECTRRSPEAGLLDRC